MFRDFQWREQQVLSQQREPWVRYLSIAVITGASIALMAAVISSTKASPELAAQVMATLTQSGVENPVTAVLLNFRSYDTLLEVAVLLIVAVAMLPAYGSTREPLFSVADDVQVHIVQAGLTRWLVPLALLIGGYLLWTGSYSPGGAFQAGAVFAAAGVALSLTGRYRFAWHTATARSLLVVGLVFFVGAAAINWLLTGTVLQYPVAWAGAMILVIETAATLSIAAVLLMLYTRLAQEPTKRGAVQ